MKSLAFAPRLAGAGSLRDTLGQFGLLGTWSPACARPASPENNQATIDAPRTGDSTIVYSFGPQYKENVYVIHSAKRLDGDRVQLREEFLSDGSIMDVVMIKSEQRLRVLSSKDADGTVYVDNGRIRLNGHPSQWMQRCS
jgi:hypothetical protein